MRDDRVRRARAVTVAAHARAAESHAAAAALFARAKDLTLAARESELAGVERRKYADGLSRHPECAEQVQELLAARGVSDAVRELAAGTASSV